MHMYRGTFLTLLLPHLIPALEVTPKSRCSSLCDNNITDNRGSSADSKTGSYDLSCADDEYEGPNSTVVGRKFKDCVNCQLNSNATDSITNENDALWVLFHMKFTFDWCVFAYPDNPQITEAKGQCGDVCGGPSNSAKLALVDRLMGSDVASQYQYCNEGDGAFSKMTDDCMKCLNKVSTAKTLVNFLNALNVACDQQPRPGMTIKLDFELFPTVPTPSSSPSTASSVGIVTVTATPAYPPTSSPAALAAAPSSRATASVSAAASAKSKVRVGVGVGVGIGGAALILALTAIILFRRRSTRNREKFEGEARARSEAEYLVAHGAPYNYNSSHQVGVAELSEGHVPELSAPNSLAEADGRRLDPELQGSGVDLTRTDLRR